MNIRRTQIEYGDFQTPDSLALDVCKHLLAMGVKPDVVIEPTCGVGAFVISSAEIFKGVKEIRGYDINAQHLDLMRSKIKKNSNILLKQADFFSMDWDNEISQVQGTPLIIGNFPWVTNTALGSLQSSNLPAKSNFLKHSGFDAISGKANFDISEWMLIEVLRWLTERNADIAMLVKTSVARKILSYAEKQNLPTYHASITTIDAKKYFNASVEACLLIIRLSKNITPSYDYFVFDSFTDIAGRKVGHRRGHTVSNLDTFEQYSFLLGHSSQKWRSGVKHDASSVMELTATPEGLKNGLGEIADIESDYLFPLLKGSDIGSNKIWRKKYVIVTQKHVGEATDTIKNLAPKTWAYLLQNSSKLDTRGSSIYSKNPRFSIFGVGEYTFRPWRIAICGLYKNLQFRLIGPIDGKPVIFDDTVYYLSFDTETEARNTFAKLNSTAVSEFLSSLIFWDEKRPIKTSILNFLDLSSLEVQVAA